MSIYSKNARVLKKDVPAIARVRDPDRPPTPSAIALRWVLGIVTRLVISGGIVVILLHVAGYRIISTQDARNIAAVKATLLAAGVEATPLTEDETTTLSRVIRVMIDLLAPPTDTIRLNDIATAFSSRTTAPRDTAARHVALANLLRRLETVPRERRADFVDGLLVNVDAQTQVAPMAHILARFPKELAAGLTAENKAAFERALALALTTVREAGSVAGAEEALKTAEIDRHAAAERYQNYAASSVRAIQEIRDKHRWVGGCVTQFNACIKSR